MLRSTSKCRVLSSDALTQTIHIRWRWIRAVPCAGLRRPLIDSARTFLTYASGIMAIWTRGTGAGQRRGGGGYDEATIATVVSKSSKIWD